MPRFDMGGGPSWGWHNELLQLVILTLMMPLGAVSKMSNKGDFTAHLIQWGNWLMGFYCPTKIMYILIQQYPSSVTDEVNMQFFDLTWLSGLKDRVPHIPNYKPKLGSFQNVYLTHIFRYFARGGGQTPTHPSIAGSNCWISHWKLSFRHKCTMLTWTLAPLRPIELNRKYN